MKDKERIETLEKELAELKKKVKRQKWINVFLLFSNYKK